MMIPDPKLENPENPVYKSLENSLLERITLREKAEQQLRCREKPNSKRLDVWSLSLLKPETLNPTSLP